MKKHFLKQISLVLATSLLCISFTSCKSGTESDSHTSKIGSTTLQSDNASQGTQPVSEEKDEEYITEDEKWERVADGMLGSHGAFVESYDGYLGYGYNMITAAYYNHNDINSAHPVVDMDKLAKKRVVYIDNNAIFTDPKTYISSSTKEYAQALSAKAKVQGKFPLSGSFKANFELDTDYEMKSNQKLVTLQANLQTRKDYISQSTSKLLAENLSQGFIDDVNAIREDADESQVMALIDKYGTHVLTNVTMGGRFDLNYLYTSKSTSKTTDIHVSLQASYRFIKGSTDVKDKEDSKEIVENSTTFIRTYGGSVTVDPSSVQSALESYGKWSEQVQAGSVTLVDASEVIPIWDVIKAMGDDYKVFGKAVQNYCEKATTNAFAVFKDTKGVTPPAQTYISEVFIGQGSTAAEAKGQLYNRGVKDADIVNLDLNKNAGGAWIYLGYKTTTEKEKAITHIIADYYSKPQSKNIKSNGYDMSIINVNLNEKASGKYIYLYYTRNANVGKPLTDIKYQFGDEIQGETPDGYNGVRCFTTGELMDFNMGTKGTLIYLWFKRG